MSVAHVVAVSRSRRMSLAGQQAEAQISLLGRPLAPRVR